jgi:UDP-N-acetylmuramate dehydrogenase
MSDPYEPLQTYFGERLKRDDSMARHTVARLGGPADALITANTIDDLTTAIKRAHENHIPWMVLGGGSNVLVSDAGVRGLVIVNHVKSVKFNDDGWILAESGTSLSTLARQCISKGIGGLEWAVNVPGTVGGAVINNAGAHGGSMADCVRRIEVYSLQDQPHIEMWSGSEMDYEYRYSVLKGSKKGYIVLAAHMKLEPGHDPEALNAKADTFVAHRKRTQPPGASLGSMFKNPPGDYAGRLIEAAGLKGTTIGGVQISPIHANFFINLGGGTASDYRCLIDLARETVQQKFNIELHLEIECIGDWSS